MKQALIIVLLAAFGFAAVVFPQKVNEPKWVGSWNGGEDFGEFIFHRTEHLGYYLQSNPGGKIIARLCSKDRMALALASSKGFAFGFPWYAELLKIPADKVFFARNSKCAAKTEQYWFVPENAKLDYEEIILAKNLKITRIIEDYYENPENQAAREAFADGTKEFIAALKNNSKAEGFIISNLKTRNKYLQKALRELKKAKIDKSRFQIVKKKQYPTYYPEFMTVAVKE